GISTEQYRILALLGLGRVGGRLLRLQVDEVLLNQGAELRRELGVHRLPDHLALPRRQVDECSIALDVVEFRRRVLQRAVRLALAGTLGGVLFRCLAGLLALTLTRVLAGLLTLGLPLAGLLALSRF